MKLLEYEAKHILKQAGLPVPDNTLIARGADVSSITVPIVLKSQVPTGGRGKLGGIQVITDKAFLKEKVDYLFSHPIKGHIPIALLAEDLIQKEKEFYLSLTIDRDDATIQLSIHKEGGVDIEENKADSFLSLPTTRKNITANIEKVAKYLDYPSQKISPFLEKLFESFMGNDATLIEVNPLILTKTNALVCGDCKMELDDAAAFRHPEWKFVDTPQDANFVTLNQKGAVGTIANGAGLAMVTVDAVARSGLTPANFLDIGGGANMDSILKAFRRMGDFTELQAIVINIFAGITRCDEVARAIIAAREQMSSLPPLFIRLAGTNFEEAVALLSEANITTLATLEECIAAVKKEGL